MTITATIDRVKGETAVLLVGDEGTPVNVPRTDLSEYARQGDVLRLEAAVDREATETTREAIEEKLERLQERGGGETGGDVTPGPRDGRGEGERTRGLRLRKGAGPRAGPAASLGGTLFAAGILLLAANLRASLTSVAPLIGEIRQDADLGGPREAPGKPHGARGTVRQDLRALSDPTLRPPDRSGTSLPALRRSPSSPV